MNKQDKALLVSRISEAFLNTQVIIVVHYKGLSVSDLNTLRDNLYDKKANIEVIKNTLVSLALKNTSSFHSLSPLLSGPTAFISSSDPVSASKVLVDFIKDHESLVLLGAAMGETFLNPLQIEAMSKLPSMDAIRGQLVGLIRSPSKNIASSLYLSTCQLLHVTKAYSESQ